MSSKSKKVLVTGVAGFLGSHLAESLVSLGHKVVGLDNMIGGYEDNVPRNIEFHNFDCCDFNKVKSIMKDVEVVYHCAATAHEGLSVFSPYEITKNNYLASVSIFSAAVNEKVKRIIFCSSMARYGDQKAPFSEKMLPKPVDPYAISKVASEEVLKNLCDLNNIEWVIAVPHNIIGPRQKYDDPFRNVVSIMTNLMLQNRNPIIYGDGNQKRSFSDIDDCIYCIDKLVTDKKIKSEIVNIGPDDNYISINELYKLISNKLKFNKEPLYYPDRTNEVKFANCSAEKSKKILGYKKIKDINESLDDIINYIKNRGTRDFSYDYNLEIFNEKTPDTWKNKIF